MIKSSSPRSTVLGFILGWTLFSNPVWSLAVTGSSSCTETCGDNGVTFSTDLVCTDSSFNETSKGLKLKNCLLCESTSTAYDSPTQNDVYWFLFNQKYILQDCLFDREPDVSLSPCESSCLPLRSVFKTLWYQDGWIPQYEYCEMGGGAVETYAGDCADCLRGKTGSMFLGNFMDTLDSGCRNKPNASDGETVKLRQALFATETKTSVPTTSASKSTGSPTATSTASTAPTASETSAPDAIAQPESSKTKSSLSTGAAAGIGVGAGAGGLIVIAAIVWVFFLRKRRRPSNEKYAPGWSDESTSSLKYSAPLAEMPAPEFANRRELEGTSRAELPGS
ncbi:hypothetical protein P170DRAFT_504975 [Aspergillus steynii IBT 23096]|uniref:LPXTG-domain-containing protein n=1 Tax=Aspergillus steynii IBT 23096 TaxID=1392250 RepID=A0A2I2GMW5_9EURO|nr:uncharacterized protein P170DRAFT_504975 [Aspergillus steynii IBT 23096]PLB54189.1 hypothetical protein P170DRAFT_504975 [Aspergillus steynii IBT 23096]